MICSVMHAVMLRFTFTGLHDTVLYCSRHDPVTSGPQVTSSTRYRDDFSPLVEGCGCYHCRNHKRACLRHLLVTNELLAGVLLMLHNMAHYCAFFTALRGVLASDRLDLLKKRVLLGRR
ncbi:queuine tRNA-ribosyltransferase accessory subunit 2 [Oncorhynchus keta]|uniref:queuine tRNA-ribosyltransferase accessory subunit 2 n=1 Tax=Oncorhynchus keta TaxID=8018 RepID=UPI00227D6859|nr:queuine tRNA-ribosyltransferase accessory subunit 2 [Oncorhynchus keta]